MKRDDIIKWAKKLTDKEFVEFFYECTKERNIYKAEKEYTESHLVLANAYQHKNEDVWGEWGLEVIALQDPIKSPESYSEEVPICQGGKCCDQDVICWAKNVICPLCAKPVYLT